MRRLFARKVPCASALVEGFVTSHQWSVGSMSPSSLSPVMYEEALFSSSDDVPPSLLRQSLRSYHSSKVFLSAKKKQNLLPPLPSGVGLKRRETPYYTFVFDMDETLLNGNRFVGSHPHGPLDVRDNAVKLLNFLKKYAAKQRHNNSPIHLEVVLWTAAMQCYAEAAMVKMLGGRPNVDKIFDRLIVRETATWYYDDYNDIPDEVQRHPCFTRYTKRLSLLGRDMKRVVIVENSESVCLNNPRNAIIVEDYYPLYKSKKQKDNELVHVQEILKGIMDEKPKDVRPFMESHPRKHMLLKARQKAAQEKRKEREKERERQRRELSLPFAYKRKWEGE